MDVKTIANKKDILSHLQTRLTGIGIKEDNKYINMISVSSIILYFSFKYY